MILSPTKMRDIFNSVKYLGRFNINIDRRMNKRITFFSRWKKYKFNQNRGGGGGALAA